MTNAHTSQAKELSLGFDPRDPASADNPHILWARDAALFLDVRAWGERSHDGPNRSKWAIRASSPLGEASFFHHCSAMKPPSVLEMIDHLAMGAGMLEMSAWHGEEQDLAGWERDSNNLRALLGILVEAPLATSAEGLCAERPELAFRSASKPFGLAELAAAEGDLPMLGRALLATPDADAGRWREGAAMAEAFEQDAAAAMLRSWAERHELASQAPTPPLTKGSPTRSL